MKAMPWGGACVCRRRECLSLQPPSVLPRPDEELVESLEILVGIELDRDAAAASTAENLHFRSKCRAELGGDLTQVGIAAPEPRPRSCSTRRVDHLPCESLSFADGETLRDHGRERSECIRKR